MGAAVVAGLSAPALACTRPGNLGALTDDAGSAMNAERDGRGRTPLTRDARLDRAAQDHACWMSASGAFSHTGAGGSSLGDRIEAVGFPTRLAAENIALGQPSGPAVVADWMKSSGHRDNILLRGAEAYGVGLAMLGGQPVWVMVFAGSERPAGQPNPLPFPRAIHPALSPGEPGEAPGHLALLARRHAIAAATGCGPSRIPCTKPAPRDQAKRRPGSPNGRSPALSGRSSDRATPHCGLPETVVRHGARQNGTWTVTHADQSRQSFSASISVGGLVKRFL